MQFQPPGSLKGLAERSAQRSLPLLPGASHPSIILPGGGRCLCPSVTGWCAPCSAIAARAHSETYAVALQSPSRGKGLRGQRVLHLKGTELKQRGPEE